MHNSIDVCILALGSSALRKQNTFGDSHFRYPAQKLCVWFFPPSNSNDISECFENRKHFRNQCLNNIAVFWLIYIRNENRLVLLSFLANCGAIKGALHQNQQKSIEAILNASNATRNIQLIFLTSASFTVLWNWNNNKVHFVINIVYLSTTTIFVWWLVFMENPTGSYNTQQTVLLQSYLSNHKFLFMISCCYQQQCVNRHTIDSNIDR